MWIGHTNRGSLGILSTVLLTSPILVKRREGREGSEGREGREGIPVEEAKNESNKLN